MKIPVDELGLFFCFLLFLFFFFLKTVKSEQSCDTLGSGSSTSISISYTRIMDSCNILLSCMLVVMLIEIGCYVIVGINQGLQGTLAMAR